jgi:hypothetical protein
MTLRDRIVAALFGKQIQDQVNERLAAISARVDDSPGWISHNQAGPADRPWAGRAQDLDDAFTAWQKNFLIRRIVTLARSYIIGNGITVTSKDPTVAQFVARFLTHPQNRIDQRLGPALNELIRAGELFPTLHTNRKDGMSFLRFVPAASIREIKTADNDYEIELEYGEQQKHTTELKWWIGPGHKHAFKRARGGTGGRLEPLMLHFAINREIGCTRGESDLTPVLPWAKRYTGWLQDRVRLNRIRTRQGLLDIAIEDDSMVEQKRDQLRRTNPLEAGVYVHGKGETVAMHGLSIEASDAEDDGKALRLAVVAAANVGLHYMGEGETVNYATAKEMGEPTARYYLERQGNLVTILCDLIAAAYRRFCALGFAAWPDTGDLQLVPSVSEVARADNESLAKSANWIVRALVEMAASGWIDDETAARLAYKFAGEPLGTDEIAAVLAKAKKEQEMDKENGEMNQEQEQEGEPEQ